MIAALRSSQSLGRRDFPTLKDDFIWRVGVVRRTNVDLELLRQFYGEGWQFLPSFAVLAIGRAEDVALVLQFQIDGLGVVEFAVGGRAFAGVFAGGIRWRLLLINERLRSGVRCGA